MFWGQLVQHCVSSPASKHRVPSRCVTVNSCHTWNCLPCGPPMQYCITIAAFKKKSGFYTKKKKKDREPKNIFLCFWYVQIVALQKKKNKRSQITWQLNQRTLQVNITKLKFFLQSCVYFFVIVVLIPECKCISFEVCRLLYNAPSVIDSCPLLFMFVYCAAWFKSCLLLSLSNAMKGAFITIWLQVKGENGDKWTNCTMMNRVSEPGNIYSVHG